MKSTQMGGQYYQDQNFHDLETEKSPWCRFCWSDEGELITPCGCTGNFTYAHESCLAKEIETARIMRVANVDGFYNSRCSLCKFHIQFKIQETNCSLSSKGIKEAMKSLDEDQIASLGLNISISILVLAIFLVTIVGYFRSEVCDRWNNCQTILISLVLLIIEYFLLQNVVQRLPRKIKKPIFIASLSN